MGEYAVITATTTPRNFILRALVVESLVVESSGEVTAGLSRGEKHICECMHACMLRRIM